MTKYIVKDYKDEESTVEADSVDIDGGFLKFYSNASVEMTQGVSRNTEELTAAYGPGQWLRFVKQEETNTVTSTS